MKRELVITKDGSHSIYLVEMDEHYHSIHGSIHESEHIFIQSGLMEVSKQRLSISILEIGMGTGLNVLKTALAAKKNNLKIKYHAVEAYPVELDEINRLNYADLIEGEIAEEIFYKIHQGEWHNHFELTSSMHLLKSNCTWQDLKVIEEYKLVYFDAFAPEKQPEMWEEGVFQKVYDSMLNEGILVTYCVKGEVRRLLKKLGFEVEKIPGPVGGKREILRARKT